VGVPKRLPRLVEPHAWPPGSSWGCWPRIACDAASRTRSTGRPWPWTRQK